MLAAIAVTARHGGRAAVKALLGRLRFRGVAGRWFILALVLGSVTVVPALVHLFTGGSTDAHAVAGHLAAVPLHFLIVATVGGGLDEELGWRGVAQPQLQLRMSPVPANLLLGVVWATWHLPLWLDPSSAQAAYPFLLYAVVIIGHSLVTGYLYNASGGSLLIAVLVHSTNNTGDGIRYAILGQAGDDLGWQLLLAAASMALGAALCLYTRGHLGLPACPVESPRRRPPSVDGARPPAMTSAAPE
jgi:membrane protease YdiL (CAAX protease family)